MMGSGAVNAKDLRVRQPEGASNQKLATISAPWCFGSRATSSNVAALARKSRSYSLLFCSTWRITRGQCEDDMEVGHGQQLGGKRGQPLGACVALALGTVPVATRVIGDGLMAAAKTLIVMTTKSRGVATDDSVHHLAVLPVLVRSLPFPGARARCTEDVGHLKGGPSHLFTRLLECLTSSVLDTSRASSGLRPLADDAWTNAGTPSCRRAWHVRAGAGWYGDRRRLRAYASRSCDGACEARRSLRCRSDSGPGDRIGDGHIRPPVVLHAWE
jgi:hypothetical protein